MFSLAAINRAPPSDGHPLHLNFQNHCLLCLNHVEPRVLSTLALENPKGLLNFQPIFQFLTGTVDPANPGDGRKNKFYPVTSNLPPLCIICYDILAELHMFHAELMELQRKIQNQTEAARRIAKGTMRGGGMRAEFFNRLKIAGLPKVEIDAMEYFMGNFHGLIAEADRKAVLPQLMPLTFSDKSRSKSALSSPGKSPQALTPYSVEFADPQQSPKIHHKQQRSPQIIAITRSSSNRQAPQLISPTAILVRLPASVTPQPPPEPLEFYEDTTDMTSQNAETITVEDDDEDEVTGLTGPPPQQGDGSVFRVRVAGHHSAAAFEYEGDDDEEEVAVVEEDELVLDRDNDNDKDCMLEAKTEFVMEHDQGHGEEEEENDEGHVGEESSEEDAEEMDVKYWKSRLSSQVIMEDLDDEKGGVVPEVGIIENQDDIELIELDDDEEEEEFGEEMGEYIDDEDESFIERWPAATSSFTPGLPIILNVASSTTQEVASASSATAGSKRPYSHWCSVCGKGYRTAQRLKYHEEEHLPGGRPRPYKCDQCESAFSSRKILEQHYRIHTGERPFKCDECGSAFRQGSTLYRHKMSHKKISRNKPKPKRQGTPPPSTFFRGAAR